MKRYQWQLQCLDRRVTRGDSLGTDLGPDSVHFFVPDFDFDSDLHLLEMRKRTCLEGAVKVSVVAVVLVAVTVT